MGKKSVRLKRSSSKMVSLAQSKKLGERARVNNIKRETKKSNGKRSERNEKTKPGRLHLQEVERLNALGTSGVKDLFEPAGGKDRPVLGSLAPARLQADRKRDMAALEKLEIERRGAQDSMLAQLERMAGFKL